MRALLVATVPLVWTTKPIRAFARGASELSAMVVEGTTHETAIPGDRVALAGISRVVHWEKSFLVTTARSAIVSSIRNAFARLSVPQAGSAVTPHS